jgi:hypothetical protein
MNRQIQRGCQLSACRWATSRMWGDRASFHCDKMSSAIPKLPADRKRSFRVDDLVQAIGLSGISKSTVPKLCKDIDECVGEFLTRLLTGQWPYVWLDAILPPPHVIVTGGSIFHGKVPISRYWSCGLEHEGS